MLDTPYRMISRRTLLAAAWAAPLPALAARRKVVTVLGDSITAGLGLPAAAALPAQLQAALARLRAPALVRGAGVSGDTTAGGLARVDFSVQSDTDVCVVALGANDLLQGIDPRTTKANLDRIIRKLQARRIKVVLAGVSAPTVIGRSFAKDFNAVFPALAGAHRIQLYPDLLAGVARNKQLNQRDGLHPNARGVIVIAQRLAPTVARALQPS